MPSCYRTGFSRPMIFLAGAGKTHEKACEKCPACVRHPFRRGFLAEDRGGSASFNRWLKDFHQRMLLFRQPVCYNGSIKEKGSFRDAKAMVRIMDQTIFAGRLKELRKKKGMSQEQLADACRAFGSGGQQMGMRAFLPGYHAAAGAVPSFRRFRRRIALRKLRRGNAFERPPCRLSSL